MPYLEVAAQARVARSMVLTSVKYHGNLYILIPLNQRLALTRLRATGPRTGTKGTPTRPFPASLRRTWSRTEKDVKTTEADG